MGANYMTSVTIFDLLFRGLQIIAFEVRERNPKFLLEVLCIIGCRVQLTSEVFWRLHLCRHIFATL